MSEKQKLEEWSKVLEFYIMESGNPLKVWLVSELTKSNLANELFPSTSHGELCLSYAVDYLKQRELPYVFVMFLDNDRFRIEYRDELREAKAQEVFDVDKSNVLEVLRQLAPRLNTRI